jgi:hypothetical protein
VVAHSEQADRLVGHELGETFDGLLQRDGLILDVRVEKVQLVHAERRPASLGRLPDRLRRQPFVVLRLRGLSELETGADRPGTEFGGDDDLVPHPATASPTTEQSLAFAALTAVEPERVVVGGVDERAAGIDKPVEDRERRLLVGPGAEQHRAKTEHAHVAARLLVLADRTILHLVPLE